MSARPSRRAWVSSLLQEMVPAHGPVIELGTDTDMVARPVLSRRLLHGRLALMAYGDGFARLLRTRFPHARRVWVDATRAKSMSFFAGEKAGAVISGLPLLSMPPEKARSIMENAFHHLRADGAFYQFTYGLKCPVPRSLLDTLNLKATRIAWVLTSFPPAQIYRIESVQR